MPPVSLLFILTDQQKWDTLAAYGNRLIHMPKLDRLAGRSVVFDRAYCAQPVCGPARAAIQTGTYPHWNGQVTLDADCMRSEVPCLSELLAGTLRQGYIGRTGHNCYSDGPAPRAKDFDVFEDVSLPPAAWLEQNDVRPRDGERFAKHDRPHIPAELSSPAYIALRATEFIRRYAREPFALQLSFYEPHDPLSGPLDDLYRPEDVVLPASFARPPGADQPRKALLEHLYLLQHGKEGLDLRREHSWRRLVANYWGLCSLVDRSIGRVLDALDECGLPDRTLVVFTSDHGDMMGAHQLLGKNLMFEEALRVPLLVGLPGQRAMRRVPAPVSHVDLLPTILDFLGAPTPRHVQGRSQQGPRGIRAPGAEGKASLGMLSYTGGTLT